MKRAVITLVLLALHSVAAQAGQLPRAKSLPVAKPACICGDSCVCKPGVCPSQCPVATKPDLVTTTGQTIRWTGTAYVFVGAAPSVSGCVNGQCPLPRR